MTTTAKSLWQGHQAVCARCAACDPKQTATLAQHTCTEGVALLEGPA